MRLKFIATILACLIIASSVGCVHKPKAAEPAQVTVDRAILASADALKLVATGLNAVDDARKSLVSANQISAENSSEILEYLKVVAAKNEAARVALAMAETGNQQVDYKSALFAVVQAVGTVDPAQFGIKNAASQATLQSALAVLQSAVQVLSASFGGK
jgi:hypothetical protein